MRSSHIDFDWKNLERQMKKLGKEKAERVNQNVENAIEKGARKIERDAAKLVPVNEGQLRDAIEAKKASGSGVRVIWEIVCPAEYAPYVEFGTRPHWAPLSPLYEWVVRKGLAVDDNEAWFVADAIQAKIAREGTKPQPFMRPAFFKNERKIKRNIQEAIRKGLSE